MLNFSLIFVRLLNTWYILSHKPVNRHWSRFALTNKQSQVVSSLTHLKYALQNERESVLKLNAFLISRRLESFSALCSLCVFISIRPKSTAQFAKSFQDELSSLHRRQCLLDRVPDGRGLGRPHNSLLRIPIQYRTWLTSQWWITRNKCNYRKPE